MPTDSPAAARPTRESDTRMLLVWEAWARNEGNEGAATLFRRCADYLREDDSARLDWWEAQRTYTLAPVMDAQGWRLHEPDVLRPLHVPFRATLRAAIDAARSALPRDGESDA
jgi:hypothetical protein